ncbi:hypothetical protein [Formosa sp. L2A11]|uniref:hypothetical protein n=1 Tax=Formosa sp. L2A11 TaxID=2686363 RepID=UPI00131DE68E|nr:hypothetical protein [Formosa sp. L2A11]
MKYILSFIFILSSFFLSAQAEKISNVDSFIALQNSGSPIQAGSTISSYSLKTPSKIKGSIYLFDNWLNSSKIYFLNNESAYNLSTLNYNIQSERFEFKYSEDSLFVINSSNVDRIIIKNKKFKTYIDPDSNVSSFFEEIFISDELSLLKKYKLGINEGAVNQMTGKKLNPDSYSKIEKYYVLKSSDNDVLTEVRLNKKILNTIIEKDNLNKVKAFSKENSLSYKDESDLKIILNYSKSL